MPVEILSGIVWGGIDLSTFNLLLDFTSPKKRAVQIADFNTIAAIPLIIGPLMGGLISDNITFILSGIPLIFVMSSILRLSSVLFIYRVKEPRNKVEYPIKSVIREAVQIHPSRGLVHEVRIVEYCVKCLARFKMPKISSAPRK